MASRNLKLASLGVSTIFLLAFLKKLRKLRSRKRKLINAKKKLRRKVKSDHRPVKLQKSTLELYDSDSEAQRAKRPRLDEEEIEKSEDDDESIESLESSSDSDSSDESCYSSLISNSESDSTHSESFISDTEDDIDIDDDVDVVSDNQDEPASPNIVKPEPYDDPLSTINYDDEDRKPDLDELTEALRNANKDDDAVQQVETTENENTKTRSQRHRASAPTSSVGIKEEPKYFF